MQTAPNATLDASFDATIELADLLVGLLEHRDPYFRGNGSLTRVVAVAIARELGLSEGERRNVSLAALLRDVGRLALQERLYPEPRVELDEEERRLIQRHVDVSLDLLDTTPLPEDVRTAIRHHHEHWDGDGYPDGLQGEEIPRLARILAVADSFSAIVRPRMHRPPKRMENAIAEIRRFAGRHYDPTIVDAFLRVMQGPDRPIIGALRRQHVLVVHPDAVRATVISIWLSRQGFLPEAEPDLATARERARRMPLAAVVISVDVPDEEPEGFIRELRQTAPFADIPIVAVDADGAGHRTRLLEAGADVCLPSDATMPELRALIRAITRRIEPQTTFDPLRNGRHPQADSAWYALHGNLRDFPLTWLLQVLKYDNRTAAVLVRAGDRRGAIYLRNGDPHHARLPGAAGEDALKTMLRWQDGEFVVRPDLTSERRSIDGGLMRVLLEGAHELDRDAIFGTVRPE
ncbi:MAG: HD domain-containing phosphohydrolase [Gemmatimonadota bacterium]